MLKSLSTYLMTRGVLALIVGIIAVAWPGVTVYALVILFAVYAFLDAILQAARAFSGLRAGAVVGRLLLALVDVVAGIVALVYPGPTAVTLVVIIAIWAILFGVLELFAAFGAGEAAGTRAWFVVAGLVSIAFGVVLAARPDAGAISLAIIYGIFSLMFGIAQIVLGVQARRGSTASADRLATA
jgi:uncharacterized membrane protein HdeD (DUF308 family)